MDPQAAFPENGAGVRVHVLFTVLLFALRTAYRLPCEQANREKEPVGWQRWRRQFLEESRDHVSSLPRMAMASFIWRNTRSCSELSSRMCLQASVHARQFSPDMGSQRMAAHLAEFQSKRTNPTSEMLKPWLKA